MMLQQIRLTFTSDRALLNLGSPLSLLLGPGLYVLCRRGKKSRCHLILDFIFAAAILVIFSAMILSIGQAPPSLSELVGWLMFLAPAAVEAMGLLFAERVFRAIRWGG